MKFLTLEQFTEMWKLQDELNTQTSGANWKELNQNWDLAIKSEIMEFFDYIGWKWWKEPDQVKKPSDMQARLELVDIWHFLLSSFIEIAGLTKEDEFFRLNYEITKSPHQVLPDTSSLMYLDSPSSSNVGKVQDLSDIIHFCDWSWEELYKAYIGKVALNAFRQANGYKEGTYKKIWQFNPDLSEGLEDNYFLEQILSELSLTPGALTYQAVYHKLGIEYMCRTHVD